MGDSPVWWPLPIAPRDWKYSEDGVFFDQPEGGEGEEGWEGEGEGEGEGDGEGEREEEVKGEGEGERKREGERALEVLIPRDGASESER